MWWFIAVVVVLGLMAWRSSRKPSRRRSFGSARTTESGDQFLAQQQARHQGGGGYGQNGL